ncbi:hypothetical protein [Streptomyces sp. NPDC003327]
MRGDTVQLTAGTVTATVTGTITSRSVLHNGRGFVELLLSDGDP